MMSTTQIKQKKASAYSVYTKCVGKVGVMMRDPGCLCVDAKCGLCLVR